MHVPDGQRRNLDPKSSKGIIFGYPEGTRGYELHGLRKKMFVRSRDVYSMKISSIILIQKLNQMMLQISFSRRQF